MVQASTLVLFNKNIANFTHKRWENQCSKSPSDGASVHACAITITNDSASVHAGAA